MENYAPILHGSENLSIEDVEMFIYYPDFRVNFYFLYVGMYSWLNYDIVCVKPAAYSGEVRSYCFTMEATPP